MATTTDRNRCAICNKEKATLRCGGCSKDFCFSHVADHRQELSKQLDEVEVTRDIFRQTLTEQSSQPQKHPLVQQIDQWELESINKIRQTAEEARQRLLQYTTGHVTEIEVQLNKLTDQLRQCRQEDDFFETDLSRWTKELTRLMDALNKSPNINVRQDSVPFVKKLVVDVQNSMYAMYNLLVMACEII
jgi:chromosome segregation ATPase